MADRRRLARVNEQLKREITDLLRNKVKDPRIGFATITAVRTAPDFAHARVFVSVLGEAAEKAETLEGLQAAGPFMRGELGRRLHLRRSPELHFEIDESLEHAMHIERLLGEVLPKDGPETDEESEADGEDR